MCLKNNKTIMKQIQPILFVIGAILILVGAITFITNWELSPYLYTAGALIVAVIQLINPYKGNNVVIKRLWIQQIFGGLALLLTSLFMFTTSHNEWIVCLTIAAFLELYTVFRISHEEEKEKKCGNR